MIPRTYRFAAVGFAVASSLLALGCESGVSDKDIKRISIAEVRDLVDRSKSNPDLLVLVDPRPPAEFAAGRLPSARRVPLPPMEDKQMGLDPALARFPNIIVYGNDPASPIAAAMTKRLMVLGYKGVRLFSGGIKEWTDRGLPIELDAPSPGGG
jgi:rhodanese-related sulfurtransferase